MLLGIGSYTYPWAVGVKGLAPAAPMTAFDLLDRAAELGVTLVQICDNMAPERMSTSDLDRLHRVAAGSGIMIETGTRGLEPAHITTCLDAAERLHATLLRVIIDRDDHRPDVTWTVATLAGLAPTMKARGIRLAIENHDRFEARIFADIVRRVNSPNVGICLDTVNSFGALEGPRVVVETLAPHVINLHIKDFTVRREDHALGFRIEGRPAGEGRLDVPWLLNTIAQAGRRPNAVLEQWTPPAATIAETLHRERQWAESSIRYLRTLIPDCE